MWLPSLQLQPYNYCKVTLQVTSQYFYLKLLFTINPVVYYCLQLILLIRRMLRERVTGHFENDPFRNLKYSFYVAGKM